MMKKKPHHQVHQGEKGHAIFFLSNHVGSLYFVCTQKCKNIWLHTRQMKNDIEGTYVLIFKKVFSNFIYKSLYSSKPFSPIKEVGESNGEAQEKQEEEPQNLKRGGLDH